MTAIAKPLLFTPIALRGVALPNRVVISPMCQYSAIDGVANDWHLVHLGKFATGGAGAVIVEATAVEERGRITHGDMGLWHDGQIAPLKRIAEFIKANGAVAGIQIAHSGRKGSMQRPWFGNAVLNQADFDRGDKPWQMVGPSALPVAEGWPVPHALSVAEIASLIERWADTARRALACGFDLLEIHSAHGYLLHSFLSPLSNRRDDAYGGDRRGRTRLALEVTEAVRAVWPEDKPLFYRISSTDGVDGGWTLDDTIALAKELKPRGVDVIDCSSGGISGPATAAGVRRQPGFQVPFAERIRRESGLMTQAVGLITHPRQAEAILRSGQADLIAIGREALYQPNWPLHAAAMLGADPRFEDWPVQYGWWLVRRAQSCDFYQEPSDKISAA